MMSEITKKMWITATNPFWEVDCLELRIIFLLICKLSIQQKITNYSIEFLDTSPAKRQLGFNKNCG